MVDYAFAVFRTVMTILFKFNDMATDYPASLDLYGVDRLERFFLDARITSDRVVIRSLDFECARESLISIWIHLLVLYSIHSQ